MRHTIGRSGVGKAEILIHLAVRTCSGPQLAVPLDFIGDDLRAERTRDIDGASDHRSCLIVGLGVRFGQDTEPKGAPCGSFGPSKEVAIAVAGTADEDDEAEVLTPAARETPTEQVTSHHWVVVNARGRSEEVLPSRSW